MGITRRAIPTCRLLYNIQHIYAVYIQFPLSVCCVLAQHIYLRFPLVANLFFVSYTLIQRLARRDVIGWNRVTWSARWIVIRGLLAAGSFKVVHKTTTICEDRSIVSPFS